MKRAGNLYEQIYDMDNLRLAFIKARRGKESKPGVLQYSKNIEKNLLGIRSSLFSGEIEPGEYHFFTIFEPKERLICAATFNDRVLHHAIINVCHPVFEKYQIYDSYATRIGKGQFAALELAKVFQKEYRWFCKLDVRKYFDSVGHALLMQLLSRRFKDKRLLSLFETIIHSYHVSPGKGLPIGNLTSQYFANFFLAHADHYIKEVLSAPAYIRYMDDMVFWGNSKDELIKTRDAFVGFIQNQLELKVKPSCLNSSDIGLPFLGYVLFEKLVRLNKHSKKRFLTKMSDYNQMLENGIWGQKEFANHVLPLVAFAKFADTHDLRSRHLLLMETG
ncbi:MAG: RNA-directed DNA polymerase [Bacteroidetes bacterium]|nr:RNA-directed DNA polymerase [Bacteroidota bacterium]